MSDVNTADLVGSPPGALPEEEGGAAALVGVREAEGDIPEHATPIPDDAYAAPAEDAAPVVEQPQANVPDTGAVEPAAETPAEPSPEVE